MASFSLKAQVESFEVTDLRDIQNAGAGVSKEIAKATSWSSVYASILVFACVLHIYLSQYIFVTYFNQANYLRNISQKSSPTVSLFTILE